jgi:hypothetical protein
VHRLIKNIRKLVPALLSASAFIGVTAFLLFVSMNQNHQPDARAASSDGIVKVGEIVVFDGSNSTDPDGDKLSFTWFLPLNVTVTSPVFSFYFPEPGNFTVILEVADNDGKIDRDTLLIDVYDSGDSDNQ